MSKSKNRAKQLDLGSGKISTLLVAFAVPTVISMLVNSVYNIVDQIFIGQGVGTLGNGATNVIFPLVILFTALASLIGNGAAANLSLKLGEGKKDEAGKVVGAAAVLTAIVAIAVSVLAFIFLPQLVYLFGCTDEVYPYALDYGYIIIIGAPFMMLYTALSSSIRGDGSPQYSMAMLVVGAIINLVLDPIMIFGFNLGVKGGAIATIVGQIISAIMAILYFRKAKNFKLNRKTLKINKTIPRTLALGLSSFITQITVLILFVFMNNILTSLGANSRFGANVPLSVYGVISKISNLFISTVLGISIGAQPILGFNYGARKFDRVKETIKYVIKLNLIIGVIFNLIFFIFPRQLAGLFIDSADPTYQLFMEFAELMCRSFMCVMAINALEISASTAMQSLGEVKKATACAFLRQIILFIPISLIFSLVLGMGIEGVLWAGPVADIVTFVVAIFLIRSVFKKLDRQTTTNEFAEEKVAYKTTKKYPVITIAREYGSGGRYVGELVAKKLGVNFYDKNIISLTAKESGLAAEYIEENEQFKRAGNYAENNDDRIFVAETKVIEDLANKEACVIVGRCGNYVLSEHKNAIHVFLYSDENSKIERATKYYGLKSKNAKREVAKVNKERARHYKYYTGWEWCDYDHYDLALNVDKLGVEKTADLIVQMVQK